MTGFEAVVWGKLVPVAACVNSSGPASYQGRASMVTIASAYAVGRQ